MGLGKGRPRLSAYHFYVRVLPRRFLAAVEILRRDARKRFVHHAAGHGHFQRAGRVLLLLRNEVRRLSPIPFFGFLHLRVVGNGTAVHLGRKKSYWNTMNYNVG